MNAKYLQRRAAASTLRSIWRIVLGALSSHCGNFVAAAFLHLATVSPIVTSLDRPVRPVSSAGPPPLGIVLSREVDYRGPNAAYYEPATDGRLLSVDHVTKIRPCSQFLGFFARSPARRTRACLLPETVSNLHMSR